MRVMGSSYEDKSPVTLVGYQSVINGATQDTVSVPTPINTTGDYLIAYIYTADSGANPSSGNWTAPAGWTKLYSGSKLPNLDVYYRVATSSEPASYTWTFSRTNFYLGGFILSYRFVADIGFVGSNSVTVGSYDTQTAPAGSTSYSKSYVLATYFNTNDVITFSTPTGYTAILDNYGAVLSSGGSVASPLFGLSATGTGSSTAFLVAGIEATNFTIASAVSTLSLTSSESSESAHLYLIPKNNITLLSSTSADLGTAGLSQTVTSSSITVTSVGVDNVVVPPSGVSFDINGDNVWRTSSTNASQRVIAKNNTLRFRVTTGGSYNVNSSYTILVGTTNFTLLIDTNNYAVYTSPGTYSFTVPPGITSISMMAIGAGGGGRGGAVAEGSGFGGGGGGACSYTNSIAVTAGSIITVRVGTGGLGGALGIAGGTGGDSWASKTGASPTLTTDGVLAKGGIGKSGGTVTGAAGGLNTSGIGSVRYSGGAGGTTYNYYTTGESGGGGGGAANPAGAGPTGVFVLNQNTYYTGGKGGQGTSISTTGWGTLATSWTSTYNGGNGRQQGGGGGSAYEASAGVSYQYGGDGGDGAVVLIWGGRTFSASTTY